MIQKTLQLYLSFLIVGILLFLPVSSITMNAAFEGTGNCPQTIPQIHPIGFSSSTPLLPYQGHLRLYVVEPTSRWNDKDGKPYHFGFLDYAFDAQIQIQYGETYHNNVTWDARQAGFGDITDDNIMVIATVFNPEVNKGYSNPPTGNKFNAYYVDATAGAVPGNEGSNMVTDDFTHSVFVEEGTATWCPYCPVMSEALYEVYQSGDYPFYFIALVGDKNTGADTRLKTDYNLYGYPTAYFDGGYKVLVGGYDDVSYYKNRIEMCGKRDVHNLNLTLSIEWQESGVISVHLDITNNEELTNSPPSTPTITGPTEGKIGEKYNYTIVATDPDGNSLYYWVQWGEGCPSLEWIGPYPSGKEIVVNNTWSGKGDYIVSAKAKDIHDVESDWGTLEVHMAKTKAFRVFYFEFFQRLLERLPFLHHFFPDFSL